MSTLQDIIGQLVEEIRYAFNRRAWAQLAVLLDNLAEWGYAWTFETGLVKLEGERES